MRRLLALLAAAAVILGLSLLPTAGAQSPASGVGVATKTLAKAAPNELRAGQRLAAPQFDKRVMRYQWLRCGLQGAHCKAIGRATHRVYIVRSADVGHTLRVRAVLQGNTVAESAPTQQVGRPLPVNTAPPTIADDCASAAAGCLADPTASGAVVTVGDDLTASPGTWKHAVRFTYQWLDCDTTGANCVAIAGATTQTYTIQDADAGHTIVLQVTGYNF